MSNGNLILDESEVIDRFKKALDRGVLTPTKEVQANEVRYSIKGFSDNRMLDDAIERFEEILKQYDKDIKLYDSIGVSIDFCGRQDYQKLVDWLKELRDRRKEKWE